MKRGVYQGDSETATLKRGFSYFLFPSGSSHFYVSNFPNKNTHMGCYQSKKFKLIEEEAWPEEPELKDLQLDKNKIYRADLIWREPGYENVQLQEYFVKPSKTHAYFYKDSSTTIFKGSFPIHWFDNFEQVNVPKKEVIVEDQPEVIEKEFVYEQLALF